MPYWISLGIGGVVLVVGLWHLGRKAGNPAGAARTWLAGNLPALLMLVPVALLVVRPYLGGDLVGAGDSYFYSLQVADFVTQLRQGVLPVLVGQSEYAFNGNINSLRTAPYLTHLAGLLDLLTGRGLSFVALLNLTVVTSALLAAWAAYLVALAASGGRRLAAWFLAVAYVASPALLVPLLGSDMFATYMTAPWIVVCWHGLAEILRRENDLWPQLITAAALALTWYAHSPIAGWLSLAWALVQGGKMLLNGGSPGQWRRQCLAGLLFAALTAYVFVSVGAIGSRVLSPPDLSAFTFNYNLDSLRDALRWEFTSFTASPTTASIQVGWTLWAGFLMSGCTLLWRRRLHGAFVLFLLVLLTAFLIPLPPIAGTLWRLLPERVLAMTPWPAQRLCPLIGSGIVVLIALALREIGAGSTTRYRWCCVLLGLGCAWSLAEVRALHQRPGFTRRTPVVVAPQFTRENLVLTRYSYGLFEEPPEYFTHGWADPAFESRLLDARLDIAQDNASATLAAAGDGAMTLIEGAAGVGLAGAAEHLLAFAFTDPSAPGEIAIHGEGIRRNYTLPRSGEALAFGSAPGSARTIPVRRPSSGPLHLTISSTVPGVSFRAVPVSPEKLPVQLTGLIPYAATVRAGASGFLETPRIYIEGYAATVNGTPAAVRQSPNGLVMIPVPAGESSVVVTYPGPGVLRTAWLLSLASLAALPWLLARAARANVPAAGQDESFAWIPGNNIFAGGLFVWRQRRRALGVMALLGLGLGLAWLGWQAWLEYRSYGSMRMTIELTRRSRIRPEPLLTLGRKGAADCIYLVYEDPRHVRFGLDHWGHASTVSEPVAITYGEPHVVEIDIGGLHPASGWLGRPGPKEPADKPGFAPLTIKLDGRTVLQAEARYYAAGPEHIHLGRNPTGGSVTRGQFSGIIHAAERVPPAASP